MTKFTSILAIATQCSKFYVHRQFRDLILMTLVSSLCRFAQPPCNY